MGRLYLGQLLTQTAMWFRNFAVSLLVLDATGSATAVGLVTVAQFVPILLLGPLPGALVERSRASRVLLAANAGSVLAVAGLLGLPYERSWLPAVYAIVALGGIAQAFERPAAFGLTADLVPPERLGSSLGRHTVAASAGRFLGPGLAGLAYALAGPRLCFAVAVLLGLGVMAVVASLPARSLGGRPAPRAGPGRMPRALVVLLALSSLVTVSALNFNVTVTAMLKLELGASDAVLGLAHTVNAIGAMVGGLLVSARRVVGPAQFGSAAVGLGLGMGLAAASPSIAAFLLLSVVLGAALGWYQGALQRSVQVAAGPGRTARASSWVNLTTFGLTPAGALWAGLVADALSPPAALAIGGAGAALAGTAGALSLRGGGRGAGVGARIGAAVDRDGGRV